MWANNVKDEAFKYLRAFTANLANDLQGTAVAAPGRLPVAKRKLEEMSQLLARCYYKQGQWQQSLKKEVWTEVRLISVSFVS